MESNERLAIKTIFTYLGFLSKRVIETHPILQM